MKPALQSQVQTSLRRILSRPTPFFGASLLDCRTGEWQRRKNAWIDLGIKSEIGRDAPVYNLGFRATTQNKWKLEDARGSGMSIFDPVLCELVYRWWCPVEGQVVDPFAGGSVRGIIAQALGRKYWGCDLSGAQIIANKIQAEDINLDAPLPVWIHGNSLVHLYDAPPADLVFSCPPYGDLEKYSSDPSDLSNMSWNKFILAYTEIIRLSIATLKDNRFACFVVGDFRDKKTGFYRNFVNLTICAFEAGGAMLFDHAILSTALGTARLQVGRQFAATRKLVKIHQNVLWFCKGDYKKTLRSLDSLADM